MKKMGILNSHHSLPNQQTYRNVGKCQVERVILKGVAAPGSKAEIDNQGTSEVCTCFALAKAATEGN